MDAKKVTDENLVDSTVVGTIRNLRKKHGTDVPKLNHSSSLEDESNGQRRTEAETPESIIAGLSASDSKPKGLTMEEKFLESPQEVKRPAKQKVTMPARLYEKGVKEDRKKRREEAKKKKNEFSFFDKKNKDLIMTFLQQILTKSKIIKEYLEENNATTSAVEKQVLKDNHVFLYFTGMFETMYKAEEITNDLKNLPKSVHTKFEKCLLEKIQTKKWHEVTVQATKEKYKDIEDCFEAMKNELLFKLNNITFE